MQPSDNLPEDSAPQQLMQIAESLDDVFNSQDPARSTNFLLVVNYLCEDGMERTSLVSNMRHEDVRLMLKLQLARLEGQAITVGHA
ncbi:MAG: hypothetical protein ABWY64_13320 [Tardiphaga sp.]